MSEWRTIDSAPKDGTPVIVASGEAVGEATFCDDGWWWANSHGEYWAEAIEVNWGPPTHWMPLPEPPKD